ncbi:MAG: cysteine--tRNA ligase [Acidimicrobiia bacterium]
MHVFNTLGRAREAFEPRDPGVVSMYVCGPTVQSPPHVGHGRQMVAFDVIRRYLAWRGFGVTYVTNVTDIEDKIIAASAAEGITPADLAARSTAQFLEASRRLGVLEPTSLVYATEHIPNMIELIERLIERGHAYAADGDVYFSVRSFEEYGKLSGRRVDELVSGIRIEPGEHKRDPLDFALWKAAKPGEPTWESLWGPGRPGWHIECSAMAAGSVGFGFDIHGGGLDLVFPHHENEIAQSEAAEGAAPFARYWLHNGMVTLRGEKMSKSLGNVVGLLDLLDRHRPEAVRLVYLRAHYRQPIEFTDELAEDAAASLDRLWAFRRRAGSSGAQADPTTMDRFRAAMDDDFATPEALAALFDAVRAGNRALDAGEDAGSLAAAYDEIVGVLALAEPAGDVEDLAGALSRLGDDEGLVAASAEEMIAALIRTREEARAEREFERADRIRDGLLALGVVLEDGADGTSWHRR